MFLGCLPCCRDICFWPYYEIFPSAIDIAAEFTFTQSSVPANGGNTLAAISESFSIDGTISIQEESDGFLWNAATNLGSWQQTVYNLSDTGTTANTVTLTATLTARGNIVGNFYSLEFTSGTYTPPTSGTTDILNHSAYLRFQPCSTTGDATGFATANRELTVLSDAFPYSSGSENEYTTTNTLLAGSINDSWTKTQFQEARRYRYGSKGSPPESISLETDAEFTNVPYYPDWPTSGARSLRDHTASHSVSITRFRIVAANGDYVQPLLNWFSSDYTTL